MIDTKSIIERISAVPLTNGRRIIAVAGPPASGKSTLSAALEQEIGDACVVPMDGFHLSNEELERQNLLSRKGAPQTFDVAGFSEVILALKERGEVPFPIFDREQDCVIEGGGKVKETDTTIIVEGNYLLLDVAPWSALASLWDLSVQISVPIDILKKRLIERWIHHEHSQDEAELRVARNDLPNAKLTLAHGLSADLTISIK
ncbi:MAG: phosphoribulokinase [Sulfitobacter sp.]